MRACKHALLESKALGRPGKYFNTKLHPWPLDLESASLKLSLSHMSFSLSEKPLSHKLVRKASALTHCKVLCEVLVHGPVTSLLTNCTTLVMPADGAVIMTDN